MTSTLSWPEPDCAPVGVLSYSEWSRLRSCNLKAAFARDPSTRSWDRGGVLSGVGSARHRLVEEVAAAQAAGLGSPTNALVRSRFDTLLAAERDRLARQWSPAEVPPVKQWPDVVYVRTRLATDLGTGNREAWPETDSPAHPTGESTSRPGASGTKARPGDGEHLVEAWLDDAERALVGRVDRLDNRAGGLVVVDLKSGVGKSPEELVTRHRDQMLFYAGLVEATHGEWPGLELNPVEGSAVAVTYCHLEVDEMRDAAQTDRAAFNARLGAGHLSANAQPSQARCNWCPFQVVCPALQARWPEPTISDGPPSLRALSLVAGTVQSVRRATASIDVVVVQEAFLSLSPGPVTITRLPAALQVDIGDGLVVAGAEIAGGARVLRARWDSRVRVETAGRQTPSARRPNGTSTGNPAT